jgi:hypothetical protein
MLPNDTTFISCTDLYNNQRTLFNHVTSSLCYADNYVARPTISKIPAFANPSKKISCNSSNVGKKCAHVIESSDRCAVQYAKCTKLH